MFWNILLILLAASGLVFGLVKALVEIRQNQRRNALIYALASLAFAFCTGAYPLIQWFQPSEVKEAVKPVVESQERMERKLDDLAYIQDYDERHYNELSERYPLGWVYFVIDQKQKRIVSKDRTHLPTDLEIDWNSARIVDVSPHRIVWVHPAVFDKATGNSMSSNYITAGRVVGRPYRAGISIRDFQMWFELLADEDEKLTCLIGFRRQELTDE